MGSLSLVVLVCMGFATAMLIYATRVRLPHSLDARIADSIKAFGTAVELRFPSHRGLMHRVITLSDAVGKMMGLDHQQLRRLELAGRLRDIGLCAVPYRLVNRMQPSEWNAAERTEYLRHAEVGSNMLDQVVELRHIAPIVRFHHVRYDGKDQPAAPCGTSLPVEARILKAVVDYVWHERMQEGLMARQLLIDGRGNAFCPEAVDTLLELVATARSVRREATLA